MNTTPKAQLFDVLYIDRHGNEQTMQVMGYNLRHALCSASELVPLKSRILQVTLSPEWL